MDNIQVFSSKCSAILQKITPITDHQSITFLLSGKFISTALPLENIPILRKFQQKIHFSKYRFNYLHFSDHFSKLIIFQSIFAIN